MSNVPYHAWTHRPKALGGTDPIRMSTASYARARREYPDDDAFELTDPGVFTPIPFTQMWTNDTSVFEKYHSLSQLDDSSIGVKAAGLYVAECKVQYVGGDDMMLFQTLMSAGDVDWGFGGDGIPLNGTGQHGANVGVVTGEDPQDNTTVWGYDTISVVWLDEPNEPTQSFFFIDTNVLDSGPDPVWVNAAWMSVIHYPLASLAETDIFPDS